MNELSQEIVKRANFVGKFDFPAAASALAASGSNLEVIERG
jgi:hypothetical protein